MFTLLSLPRNLEEQPLYLPCPRALQHSFDGYRPGQQPWRSEQLAQAIEGERIHGMGNAWWVHQRLADGEREQP